MARFRRELTHPERNQETELGDLLADIFTQSLGVDVMLLGSGSIRAERLGPVVTYRNLTEAFPYDDGVYLFKVTGRQLRHMLRFMLREESFAGHTEFYQIPAALRLRYSRSNHDFESLTYKGEEVTDERIFTVGMQNFHFQNITSFFDVTRGEIARLQKPRTIATSCQDVLIEYFQEYEWLDHWLDGRITVTP